MRKTPSRHRLFSGSIRLAVVMAVLAGVPALRGAAGGETWTVGEKTYRAVRVREVTPAMVTIFHAGGVAQLELAGLPAELQTRFHFDAGAAAAANQQARADLLATAQRQREHLARAREAGRREDSPVLGLPAGGLARATPPALTDLRESVDLRPLYREHKLTFKDQGKRPSCAVFALVSAYELEVARRTGRSEPLSEEFLIWAVHALQPGIPLDDGFHFSEVLAAFQHHGVPRLSLMPNTFGRSVQDIQPPPEAIHDASTRRAIVPIWLRPDDPAIVLRIAEILNAGTPVVVGLRWPHWRTLEATHLLRDQQPLENSAHAVTIVGYRCPGGRPEDVVFTFRNSYGLAWGLAGHGFVASSYLQRHLTAALYLTLPEQPHLAAAGQG